jgi:hypothetical protein
MDLQKFLDATVKAQRQEELNNSPQLLLGELILKLEAVKNKDLPLFIDIMDKRPADIDSWRGIYAELAIATEGHSSPTVADGISMLQAAVGKTYHGYKGGDFTMSKNTPVWLAEYGESGFHIDDKEIDEEDFSNYKNVFFVDVQERKDRVYLITKIGEE